MALSPDERWLAVGDPRNDVVVIFSLDPSTGAVGNAVAATGSVAGVSNGGMAFNPNRKQLLVSSASSSVRVYNFNTITGEIGQDPAREFNTRASPSRITVADLNSDGVVSRISSC
jgi:6-phosphogluconolactonase (cycloisomerase 2 family)